MRRVAIIGPGRVGTLLAIALVRAGHRVVSVAGGSPEARTRLAARVAGVRPAATPAEAAADADLVVLTVPDDALVELATDLVRADVLEPGCRVVHVAGSRGIAPLRRLAAAGARVAACHPAMTVPARTTDPDVLVGTAWAVTAAQADRGWARELVTDLGGDPHDVPEDRRALYHAGLALGSNAVAAAVASARQLLLAASLDDPAAFLAPLAHASVDHVAARGAVAITGPVARGDVGTVTTHLRAIADDVPALDAAYRHLARATLEPLRATLPNEVVAALDAALDRDAPADAARDAPADAARDAPADAARDAGSDTSPDAPTDADLET